MSKSSERFLRTKKLSLAESDNSAAMKTSSLKSHKRPVQDPSISRRPIDQPEHRDLFEGEYTSKD